MSHLKKHLQTRINLNIKPSEGIQKVPLKIIHNVGICNEERWVYPTTERNGVQRR